VNRILKLVIVSFCGARTFIVSMPPEEKSQHKTSVMPVKNRQITQRSWIQI